MKKILTVLFIIVLCTGFSFAGEKEFDEIRLSSVKAASYSYSKIRISWNPLKGADGYIVYRSSDKNGTYKQVYDTEHPDKNWYINTNRKTGKVWWYKVRGYRIVNGRKVFTKYSEAVSAYARPDKVAVTAISSSGFICRYLNLS